MMNKKSNVYKIIFCLINSAILLFTLEFHHPINDIFGYNKDVYIIRFNINDYLIAIFYFIFLMILFYVLDKLIDKKRENKTLDISSKRLFVYVMIILLLLWSPYYLTFFPGGVYSDTYDQYLQAINGITGMGYPVFYTLFIRLLLFINAGNSSGAFGMMTIIQLLSFSLIISYFITKLKEYKVSKNIIILSILFFSLYPRIPIYAISLWKDSLFSIFLFLYAILLFDIIYKKGDNLKDKKFITNYLLTSILCTLFRNNGLYIIVIITIILFIIYRNQFKNMKVFYVSSTLMMTIIIFIYFGLFNILNYKIPYSESIGISLQQIAYVVVNEDDIDNKDLEFIDRIIPIDKIKENYFPMIVDPIKVSPSFDEEYLEKHKDDYWKTYTRLMKRYPIDFFKAHLMTTAGFWNYFINCHYAGTDSLQDYYDVTNSSVDKDISNNINVLEDIFGIDLTNKISTLASKLNNCAFSTLIMFIGIYILIRKNKLNRLIVYLPSIFIFLALLFGSPIAFSSRYIIYTIFFIPFALIIPFIEEKD